MRHPLRPQHVTWAEIQRFAPSILVLVLANLTPLVGVLWFDWDVFAILVLFWVENIVIGFYNVPRILLARGHKAPDIPDIGDKVTPALVLGMALFFMVHYGGFTYGHGTFIFSLLADQQTNGTDYELSDALTVINQYGLVWAILALIGSHGFSFAYNYVYKQRYKQALFVSQMFTPYSRVLILHLTVIIGGSLIKTVGEPLAGLVVLLLIKIFMDIKSHVNEQLGRGSSLLGGNRAEIIAAMRQQAKKEQAAAKKNNS